MAEDQALASFDFLATTGDSDSDEEEEEEDEEEERDDDEGDPTVSVEDEFTAGFVNAVEPSEPPLMIFMANHELLCVVFQRVTTRRVGS